MRIDRMELADLGEPSRIASAIHKQIGEVELPVPVEQIAASTGIIDIEDLETEGFEGGLVTDAEKLEGIILVKKGVLQTRRRFTIGHELGHFLNPWHKPKNGDQFLCSKSDMRQGQSKSLDRATRMEAEANEFSAELLAPRSRFLRDLRRRPGVDLEQIVSLASRYEMSKEAAARRYVDLHDENCAIVFSRDGVVRYPYRGPNFPFVDTSNGSILPEGSVSQAYDGAPGTVSGLQEVGPEIWLSNPRKIMLYEQTLLQQNGFQMTLLSTEEDEDAEEDAELTDAWTPRFRRR